MSALWQPLRDELKCCRAAGMALPFWWRDDDATASSPELDRLSTLAGRCDMAVHLAVIPAAAKASLAEEVTGTDLLVPLVHGWSHTNHAPQGAKKAEFGHPRRQGSAEINMAFQRLKTLFGPRFLPIFVPPWNRFDDSFLDALKTAGFRGISTFLPRVEKQAAPGLVRINTHIDPIDWRGTRGLANPEMVIAKTCARLRARREGLEDATEPLGLLTHHLVHTADVWQFTETFLNEMLTGGATPVALGPLTETAP